MKGHIKEKCFVNPHNPACNMTATAKRSLKEALMINRTGKPCANNSQQSNDNNSIVSFGEIILHDEESDEKIQKNISHGKYGVASLSKTDKCSNCLDSGASVNMFLTTQNVENGSYNYGSKEQIQLACGKKKITCEGSGVFKHRNLRNPDALHVPNLNMSLVSDGQICQQGKIVVFTKREGIILNKKEIDIEKSIIESIVPRDRIGLYIFKQKEATHKIQQANAADLTNSLWHQRFVHINDQALQLAHKHTRDVPKIPGSSSRCHPCIRRKQTKKSFTSKFEEATYPGDVIHSDLSQPGITSISGSK